jgi:hypothetical protein
MTIHFRKLEDKPCVLSVLRDDGSETWQSYGNQSDFFPIHDLTHYAVETELGYQNAFFGIIAAGREIGDFGPGDAATLHHEAHHAEMIVGLIGIPNRIPYREILEIINSKSAEKGLGSIELTEFQLDSIQFKATQLIKRWDEICPGETLVLEF